MYEKKEIMCSKCPETLLTGAWQWCANEDSGKTIKAR